MDKFPKFIIETNNELVDCLILSKVTFHKDLVIDKSKVKGGGWFIYNDDNFFTFYGKSEDFGPAKMEDIKKCIESGNVYTNPFCSLSIANRHKFFYNTGSELIPLN